MDAAARNGCVCARVQDAEIIRLVLESDHPLGDAVFVAYLSYGAAFSARSVGDFRYDVSRRLVGSVDKLIAQLVQVVGKILFKNRDFIVVFLSAFCVCVCYKSVAVIGDIIKSDVFF